MHRISGLGCELHRSDGYSGIKARRGINTELTVQAWEQLAGPELEARSAQRWHCSDLLQLLKGKLSQKVFI